MKTLNEMTFSGMPQMQDAFDGWENKLSLVVITQQIINGLNQDLETRVSFQGTIQPLTDRALQFKPEGLRSFTWLMIHARLGQLNLGNNDRIIFNGKKYKILGVWDYSLNGYMLYHAVLDFTGGADNAAC
jgi:hypothetical protein